MNVQVFIVVAVILLFKNAETPGAFLRHQVGGQGLRGGGAARTELESQLQRAVKVSAKGKHVKCKMDLERCLFWDPAGNRAPPRGVRAPQGPRACGGPARVADGQAVGRALCAPPHAGAPGGAVLPVLGRLAGMGRPGPARPALVADPLRREVRRVPCHGAAQLVHGSQSLRS